VTKLLRDELKMVEVVEVMSRRIEALEKDKLDLQVLATTQFDRMKRKERDHRRLNWLENHPSMIDHFEGYWYYVGRENRRMNSFREAIDAAMKDSKGKT
jgi:hypothetical protein